MYVFICIYVRTYLCVYVVMILECVVPELRASSLTTLSYEGTGRSLSLKLLQQLRHQSAPVRTFEWWSFVSSLKY
jgi:tRNA(Met) C34 N-acetyltransferase TmcA